MKTKYCFIRNPHHFTREDVVYIVYVGTSEHDQVKLTLISEYVKESGIYFRKWSNSVDVALTQLCETLFSKSLLCQFALRTAEISVQDLYELIIDDSWSVFEEKLTTPRPKLHLLAMLSPNVFFQNSGMRKKSFAFSVQRQNLSHNVDSELISAVVHFGLILILFLIGGYLEGISVCYGW